MVEADVHRLLRRLPSVDDVLRSSAGIELLSQHPRWAVVAAARAEIDDIRRQLQLQMQMDVGPRMAPQQAEAEATPTVVTAGALSARVQTMVRPSLRRAINATGVVLHTNLGRAPLPARALARMDEIARGYSTLEYDPALRGRGSRHDHAALLLCQLTGAEAAAVVNNNAGAVLIALSALASGRQVVVSRGELIEIGGNFRIPDVMRASGAVLHEVGTTNKTRLADYTEAMTADTALLLKVHRSNFAVVGFTEDTPVAALVQAGGARSVPVMVDLGSGSLVDTTALGLPAEPTVGEIVRAGVDLCTFSGDKLLGGPQAGIIVGRRDAVAKILSHPLMRALRPDKMTLAALEATLEIYRDGSATRDIPALRMLAATPETLAARKDELCAALAARVPRERGLRVVAQRARSAVGGGALPLAEPETWAVTLDVADLSPEALAQKLADGDTPVVGRIADDRLILDVRTLGDDEIVEVAGAVARALARHSGNVNGGNGGRATPESERS